MSILTNLGGWLSSLLGFFFIINLIASQLVSHFEGLDELVLSEVK